ncbi:DUF7620 family protein [Streptosporangium sandarakinum]
MTQDERPERPDLRQAAEEVEVSRRRAEAERARAREWARSTMTLAERLRRLREANHFGELLAEALRGRRG